MLRIFEPILKNATKELLHGSHTRAVSISTPSNSGIMKFAKKQLSCIGCKTPIRYLVNTSRGCPACVFLAYSSAQFRVTIISVWRF